MANKRKLDWRVNARYQILPDRSDNYSSSTTDRQNRHLFSARFSLLAEELRAAGQEVVARNRVNRADNDRS
jgi:hypothetical protein